jgi:hypothetical protein
MYRFIFSKVKSLIPKISETEMIALRSGSVSLDREIFNGRVNLPQKFIFKNKFDDNIVDNLLKQYGNEKVFPSKKIRLNI